jgi:hypothetical protein
VRSGGARSSRHSRTDVRPGDRLLFRIQELKCPLGSIWLEPHRRPPAKRRDMIWDELATIVQGSQKTVPGRILNRIPDGYAVGIAGYVGKLPLASADPASCQLGKLQMFVLTSVSSRHEYAGRTFTVAHPGWVGGVDRDRQRYQMASTGGPCAPA